MIRFIRKDYVYNIFSHIVFILILALTMCSSGIFLSQINREKVLYDIVNRYSGDNMVYISVCNKDRYDELTAGRKAMSFKSTTLYDESQVNIIDGREAYQVVVYPDKLIKELNLQLDSGKRKIDGNNDEYINVYVSKNSFGAKKGDIRTAYSLNEEHPYSVKYKIAGIISDNQTLMSIYGGFERIAEVNYTQMYDSYYYNENGLLMIIPESEFSKIEKTADGDYFYRNVLINMDDMDSVQFDEYASELVEEGMEMFSGVNGVINLTENGFVSNSDKIYARENGKNIPIAIIILLMMTVCIDSILLIKLSNDKKTFGVIQILGMNNRKAAMPFTIEVIFDLIIGMILFYSIGKLQMKFKIFGNINFLITNELMYMIIIYAALVAICTYLMCRLLNMRKTSFQLVAQKN